MHLSFPILSLLSLSLTTALPHAPRDAPTLLTTISELNTAVTSLTTAVNAFSGTLSGLLPEALGVISAETRVDTTVLKATYIASASGNFTASESMEIVQSLATQIGPIQTSLDALKDKYPQFKQTLTAPVVLLDLKVLKKHTDELIDAVGQKVTPDNAGLLSLGQGILDQAFDDAIQVYSA